MKVRYSYLKQQFGNAPKLWRDLKKFVNTGDFTLGKPLSEFERKFAKLIGTKYAVGVNSGTDAIKLSLKVIGIKKVMKLLQLQILLLPLSVLFVSWEQSQFSWIAMTLCMNTKLIKKKLQKKQKQSFQCISLDI